MQQMALQRLKQLAAHEIGHPWDHAQLYLQHTKQS
jgi:hypothetical protein